MKQILELLERHDEVAIHPGTPNHSVSQGTPICTVVNGATLLEDFWKEVSRRAAAQKGNA